MKKLISTKLVLCCVFIFLFFGGSALSYSAENYFDNAKSSSKEVRLAVCYPSIGSINVLLELRKQGFLPSENLIVIGIYHENERTDYQKSREFIQEQDLDWFKFHMISGELNKENLFQKNPCSKDFEEIFKKSDGIIFFGGADIQPYIYKKKTNLLTSIRTPVRHLLELSFIYHLLGGLQDENAKPLLDFELHFPVLGICLGCQSLNVGTGGTMIQDIWSETYGKHTVEDVIALGKENWHKNPFPLLFPLEKLLFYNMHRIKLVETGKFCSEFGFTKKDTPYILSGHHQMLGDLGKGMKIAATSLDGKVAEAIEHEKYPNVLGVQFHPENPILWDPTEKFIITPEEKEGINLRGFLENSSPSFAFHKKIWAWFSQKLKDYHKNK